MLVDVVCLRYEGRKIDRDKLPAGVRGELKIAPQWDFDSHEEIICAWLFQPDSPVDNLLPPLERATITRCSGDSFVLVGVEDCSYRKLVRRYRQAWWVRLAMGDGELGHVVPVPLR